MHGHMNVQFITMHGHMNVQFITMHGHVKVKFCRFFVNAVLSHSMAEPYSKGRQCSFSLKCFCVLQETTKYGVWASSSGATFVPRCVGLVQNSKWTYIHRIS
jgi:hypothetical protein